MRLHLETTSKWDGLAEDHRSAQVAELVISMHLPYLLECSSPFDTPLGAMGRFYAITFDRGQRSISYSDGHIVADTYTIASVSIKWSDQHRITMQDLIRRPLVEETVFPVMVVNSI